MFGYLKAAMASAYTFRVVSIVSAGGVDMRDVDLHRLAVFTKTCRDDSMSAEQCARILHTVFSKAEQELEPAHQLEAKNKIIDAMLLDWSAFKRKLVF
jgi:hypothetical protein